MQLFQPMNDVSAAAVWAVGDAGISAGARGTPSLRLAQVCSPAWR